MATLNLRVNKKLSGWDAQSGALGYIYRRLDRKPSSELAGMKLVAGPLAIPVGPEGTNYTSVPVDPGEYVVQIRMPAGDELNQAVVISSPTETVPLTMEGERSPNKWLSVDHFMGRISGRDQYTSMDKLTEAERMELLSSVHDILSHAYELDASGIEDLKKAPKSKKRLEVKTLKLRKKTLNSSPPLRAPQKSTRKPKARPDLMANRSRTTSLNHEREIVSSVQTEWDSYRKNNQSKIQEFKSEFPVWQLVTAIPEGVDLPEGTVAKPLSSKRLFHFWAGTLVSATRLAFNFSDDFHLKATIDYTTADSGSPLPDALRDAFSCELPSSPNQRRFFAGIENGKLSRLGVLPIPWHVVTGGTNYGSIARTELLIHYRQGLRMRGPNDSAAGGAVQYGLSIDDPNILAILGFLKSGNLVGTSALINQAEETLIDKMNNPYAAAAAGYVLLESFDPSESDIRPEWVGWVRNLENWFAEIPDGAIQRGWLELQYASQRSSTAEGRHRCEKAREHFLYAVMRGIPFYPQGVRLLVDGLTLIVETDATEKNDPTLKAKTEAALMAARWLSLRTDSREVFTVLKV